jgi:RNA polymerase sigma-70 factor (ECF subfamily)
MQADETTLVERARRGELRAATEIVDQHYEAIHAFLRRLAGNDADSADLTQKTFARVWTALPRFAGRSSLGSWLHGIAYHVYQDWRRANHRLESRPDEWWAECRDGRAGPDALAADADLADALYAAVDGLEPDTRITVHLHYYQGLTLEETAESLGIAASTVKYRLRAAVSELQTRLAEPSEINRSERAIRQP